MDAQALPIYLATWILILAATFGGYLMLIIPGIYAGLRLFWADEFALVLRSNPIEALRQSWRLTEGKVGAVFLFQFLMGLMLYAVLIAGVVLLLGLDWILPDGSQPFVSTLFSGSMYMLIYLGYALLHAPEMVCFYGQRASGEAARRPS